MVYDIYFHDDFDGRASAAVLWDYLKKRGDDIKGFYTVDYALEPRWPKFKFPRPAIIVDFLYHPKAAMWFDHHVMPFLLPAWKKSFRRTKNMHWDSRYASCCHFIMDELTKYLGYRPPVHIRELAKWLDVIDGANYKSARQVIEMKEAPIQLAYFIEGRGKKGDPKTWLIKLLAEMPLGEIVKVPRVAKTISRIRKDLTSSLAYYRAHSEVNGKTVFTNVTEHTGLKVRFAPFYLFPTCVYSLTLKRERGGNYHLTVGASPWRREENGFHIGKFMHERFGGGGHKNVGGADIQSGKRALAITREIIKFLLKRYGW